MLVCTWVDGQVYVCGMCVGSSQRFMLVAVCDRACDVMYLSYSVCVCACVRACVFARACAYLCV